MKKITCLVTLVCCVLAVFAQRGGLKSTYVDKRSAFKINLLSPIRSTLNLSWHHALTPLSGLQVTAAYMDFDSYGEIIDNGSNSSFVGSSFVSTYSSITNQQTRGFAIIPEYRYMLNGRGLSGIYAGPFLRYAFCNYNFKEEVSTYSGSWPNALISYTSSNQQINYHSVGIGLVVGKQHLFKNTCVVDIFCGPVYSFLLHASNGVTQTSDIQIGSSLSRSYLNGYGIRFGITFGLVR